MSQTIPPNLDPLPEAPSTNKPSVFAQVMDAFLAALIIFRTQLVAFGQNVYTNAVDAYNSALAAAASALAALNSATDAAASANQAQVAANNAGIVIGALPFVPNQVYPQGGAAVSNSNQQTYRRNSLGSSATDPSADSVNWTRVLATPDVQRFVISAAATLTRSHQLGLVDLTGAGGFTLTIDTAVNLKSGWACWVRNLTTGDITVQRSGADNVDARTSYKMYPGEVRFFQGDGVTDIRSFVLNGFVKEFRSSATFEKPPGYAGFDVDLVSAGAGGAGGGASAACGGGGGGAGGRRRFFVLASAIALTVPVVIGLGGTGGAAGTNGTAGGNTQFGSFPLVYGGAPGGYVASGNSSAGGGGGGTKWAPTAGGSTSSDGIGAGNRSNIQQAIFELGGSSTTVPMTTDWGGPAGGPTSTSSPWCYPGGSSIRGPGAGGGGANIAGGSGGTGGSSGSTAGPAMVGQATGDGPSGTDAATSDDCGTGGAGGNGGSGVVGRKGGNGGYPGGGGGGGGSGNNGGTGGNGANGRCVIKGVL